jgi:HAD superfamily hydrolase (TIGR01458 family)
MGDRGIDGLLLDIDGVLAAAWRPLPGALEALAALRARGVPLRLLTNTTTHNRRSLASRLQAAGFDVRPEDLITASSATAEYLKSHHPTAACYLLATGDVREDLGGVRLVERGADVVVVAGAEDEFSYENMNRAFQMLMDGASLVAMHRNLYWMTDEGLKLDAGAFIRGLEEASGVKAVTVGKPSPTMFEAGLGSLGLPANRVAMVGDDVENDVLAAQVVGITGILVRTGKFNPQALEAASGVPDHLIDSVAELPALIGR